RSEAEASTIKSIARGSLENCFETPQGRLQNGKQLAASGRDNRAEDNAFIVAFAALLERERTLYIAPNTWAAIVSTAPRRAPSVFSVRPDVLDSEEQGGAVAGVLSPSQLGPSKRWFGSECGSAKKNARAIAEAPNCRPEDDFEASDGGCGPDDELFIGGVDDSEIDDDEEDRKELVCQRIEEYLADIRNSTMVQNPYSTNDSGMAKAR
ncbi:hypothetical protein THAOC_37048, partial [Thalassiosira oceanica]